MALITCPKCGRNGISTKAFFCVGCHCSMETINRLLREKAEEKKVPPPIVQTAQNAPKKVAPKTNQPLHVNWTYYFQDFQDNDCERDVLDYISEYRDCLDNLFDDDWFYPD